MRVNHKRSCQECKTDFVKAENADNHVCPEKLGPGPPDAQIITNGKKIKLSKKASLYSSRLGKGKGGMPIE